MNSDLHLIQAMFDQGSYGQKKLEEKDAAVVVQSSVRGMLANRFSSTKAKAKAKTKTKTKTKRTSDEVTCLKTKVVYKVKEEKTNAYGGRTSVVYA